MIAETPYLGFGVLMALAFVGRDRPSVIVEAHDDWRSATRLSGARGRVLLAPLADRIARYTLRRADALRARVAVHRAARPSGRRACRALESFPGYFDLSAFVARAAR